MPDKNDNAYQRPEDAASNALFEEKTEGSPSRCPFCLAEEAFVASSDQWRCHHCGREGDRLHFLHLMQPLIRIVRPDDGDTETRPERVPGAPSSGDVANHGTFAPDLANMAEEPEAISSDGWQDEEFTEPPRPERNLLRLLMAILIAIVVVAASIFYVLPTPLARTLRTPQLSRDLANQLLRSQPGVPPTCYQDAAGLEFLTSTVVRLGTLPDVARGGIGINFGSGSWLGGGLILTNYHVVENTASEPIDDIPGNSDTESTFLFFQPIAEDSSTNNQAGLAELVAEDQRSDLAVLLVASEPQEQMTALTLGDPRALSLGDEIVVVGFPGGVFRTYTGRVLAGSGGDWILTDAGFTEGTSGGVVLNQHCELVGVPTATTIIEGRGRVGLIRPVTLAQPLIEAARSR